MLSYSASFDCTKASSPFEKTICSNPALSGLDEQLAGLYTKAKTSSTNPDQLKADQITWIKSARACGTDVSCIQQAYNSRIAALTPKINGATQNQQPASQQAPLAQQQAPANTNFNDIGGFDKDYPQAPNDPKKIIRVEIGQYRNRDVAYRLADTLNEDYVAIQSNKNGDTWRLLTKGAFSDVSFAQPHIVKLRDELKFPSPRIIYYTLPMDNQVVASINKDVDERNKQLHASKAPPPAQKIVLMDSKSNGSVAGTCWGVMWAISSSNGYVKAIPYETVMRARNLEPIFKDMYKNGNPQDQTDKLNAFNYVAGQHSVEKNPQEFLDTYNFCTKAISK